MDSRKCQQLIQRCVYFSLILVLFYSFIEDLWLLSRTNTISTDEYNSMIDYANSVGIDTDRLKMQNTTQVGCTYPQ